MATLPPPSMARRTILLQSGDLRSVLETKAGHAMMHGGPYPATADGRSTFVGTRAIERFVRPVCCQNFPDSELPDEWKEPNPLDLAAGGWKARTTLVPPDCPGKNRRELGSENGLFKTTFGRRLRIPPFHGLDDA